MSKGTGHPAGSVGVSLIAGDPRDRGLKVYPGSTVHERTS